MKAVKITSHGFVFQLNEYKDAINDKHNQVIERHPSDKSNRGMQGRQANFTVGIPSPNII